MSCSKCDREVYDDKEECIFHCEKDGWGRYKNDLFWKKHKEEIENINGDYSYFIFPKHIITNQNNFFESAKTFKNSKFLGKVDLSDANIDNIDFSFSKFLDDLICHNTVFNNSVNFTSIEVFKKVDFKECLFNCKAKFFKSKFHGKFYFINNDIVGELNCSNSYFFNDSDFSNNNFTNNLVLNNSKFKFICKLNNVNTYSKSKNLIFDFKNVQFNQFELTNSIMKEVSCIFENTIFDDNFLCMNNNFRELNLVECKFLSTSVVEFENIVTDILILMKYENNTENITFKLMTVNEVLEIKDIVFIYEIYIKLNVITANIKFENVIYTDKLFNDTTWGNISSYRFEGDQKIFRDLKNLAHKSKNFMDATAFATLEMKKKKDTLIEERTLLLNLTEKFIYSINIFLFSIYEWVSDYGLSWLKPFFLIVYISILSYSLAKYNLFNELIVSFIILISIISMYILSEVIYLIYSKVISKEKLVLWLIVLFSMVCILDNLDNIDKKVTFIQYINPFSLVTDFKNGNVDSMSFPLFLEKLIIFSLAYQVYAAIKRQLRIS